MLAFRTSSLFSLARAKWALVLCAAAVGCAVAVPCQQPATPPHSKMNPEAVIDRSSRVAATSTTQTLRPGTPGRTMPFPPVPAKAGCYHTVDKKWVEVPCATPAEMSRINAAKPMPATSISSTAHPGPIIGIRPPFHQTSITEPFDWGSITVSQPNPVAGSEKDNTFGTNAFSIQVNPFYFDCVTCKAGYPYPLSQPGDNSWVQFVYTQFGVATRTGTGNTNLCVWQFDIAVQARSHGASGTASTCVNPSLTDTVLPIDGPGAPTGPAEVVGYITCPTSGTAACTLSAIAHLPWSPKNDWWMTSVPDQLGLNGNWINVSGGLLGVGNGSVADFSNTTLQTTVEAYTCFTNPTPTSIGAPTACAAPAPWASFERYFELTAVGDYVTPTAETNNLTAQPSTLTCAPYGCSLTYTSQ